MYLLCYVLMCVLMCDDFIEFWLEKKIIQNPSLWND